MEHRLGRGLGSLLPDAQPDEASREVPLHAISPNPLQPRQDFDPQGLDELRSSIQVHGVLQPIVLRRQGNRFEIISGERRWRACKLAGRDTVPAVVREDVSDDAMLELALVENLQRRDLNPMERARGYQRMVADIGLNQGQVARRVGLQRATVANHLRLLELPDLVQGALASGLLGMGHARALLGLADEDAQVALAEEAIRADLSVRVVEQRVRDAARSEEPAAPKPAEALPPWQRELQARLAERLATKVQVKNREGYRGQIVVEYFNREDLERLVETLAPQKTI